LLHSGMTASAVTPSLPLSWQQSSRPQFSIGSRAHAPNG
jgi:hypothetical protein